MSLEKTHPIMYSFRRCPYAMRARLAWYSSGLLAELREVVLRDKPQLMLDASAKATVPVLILPDGKIIDESLDVMIYALGVSDPEGLLQAETGTLQDMLDLISQCDGPFKTALDHYKYPNRYLGINGELEREKASVFLRKLDRCLAQNGQYIFGSKMTLVDIGILPFVRQFANVDKDWFDQQDWKNLSQALERFTSSDRFLAIMRKYPQWYDGDEPTYFGVDVE